MRNVGCENCIFYAEEEKKVCKASKTNYQGNIIYYDPLIKNKYGDCKDFSQRKWLSNLKEQIDLASK